MIVGVCVGVCPAGDTGVLGPAVVVDELVPAAAAAASCSSNTVEPGLSRLWDRETGNGPNEPENQQQSRVRGRSHP